MYERSAIILERYYNNILGFDKKTNLKTIYKDYKEIIEEIHSYQTILEEEDKVITEFDETANEIRNIQKEEKRLNKANIEFEGERNQLFDSLDEEPELIESKLNKLEQNLEKNNKRLIELREAFIETLTKFSEKQKERNKNSRNRRTEEKNHLYLIEKCTNNLKEIDINLVKEIKRFQNSEDNEIYKQELKEIMINNGKDERVPFDKNVIENAVNIRNEIAKKEAECYIAVFDKMRRLIVELNGDDIKLEKYQKTLRDAGVKLRFLKAQKLYIVSFLDNERIAAINGAKAHKQAMEETCKNIELDMEQFNNLYELILKETSNKATKKAYKELYNKEYLKNIEEKERNFEEEINSIRFRTGTIINSNYWRIEEIKNIYQTFQNEVSEKFEKDLSEFKLEESGQENENVDIFGEKSRKNDIKYIDEFDDDEYDEDDKYDDDEYEDDEYEDDEYKEDEDEYEDDEYEEDEYEDDEYEEDEDDNEYEDDEYENDDDEYEEDDEYEYDDVEEKIVKKKRKSKGLFGKFRKK